MIASSNLSGTALIVGHPIGNTGDYIKACGFLVSATRSCPNPEFRVKAGGDVYADGTYFCGQDIPNGAGTLDESEIAPCLTDSSPADFAEYLPAAPHLEVGDVLAVAVDGTLVRADRAYQTTVVGVYSTRPSYVGNGRYAKDPAYAPLTVSGVVPVKVTSANGAITAGDLLVASDVPGHAMRAGSNPAAGTVIGKALESFDGQLGLIRMLVMAR